MDTPSRRMFLLAEIERLKKELDEIKEANDELRAIIEQISVENEQVKQLVRERLEETQMLRGIM